MSVEGARTRIHGSMKDLRVKWSEAESVWRDATAAKFSARYIEQLEDAVRSALPAMERMAEILARVRSECGDPRQ
ncbi:MAG: hypothetical protein RJA12_928 [Planctomycetota bacterium]|jgi:hypothetical protein|nr:hypothetical protein [Planctomycetota bacterium]